MRAPVFTGVPAAGAAGGRSVVTCLVRRLLPRGLLFLFQGFQSQPDQFHGRLRTGLEPALKAEILDLLKQLIVHGYRVTRSVAILMTIPFRCAPRHQRE